MSQSFIAGSAIMCHLKPNDRSLWGSSLIPSIPPQKRLCRFKISLLHTPHSFYDRFSYLNISIKRYTQMDTFYCSCSSLCLCGTIESCRISVTRCLKQNGALQHLEIQIMINVYETFLANTSTNYNVFWVILILSKSKQID